MIRPTASASVRHRRRSCSSAEASGSSFFSGHGSTPGTAPPTSQLAFDHDHRGFLIERGERRAQIINLLDRDGSIGGRSGDDVRGSSPAS
jgi:hypothetical protein